MIAFFEVINTSASHIYHSALLLSPRRSIVRRLHKSYIRSSARVVHGLPISWEPNIAGVKHGGSVEKAVWSPCGKLIAIGLSKTIEILDAVTLERLHTFTHPRAVETLFLSLSSGSRSLTWFGHGDYELITWDLQTGGRISSIPSAPNRSSLLYFSSTYSMDNKVIAVAYKNSDDTVTGISTCNLLSGILLYSLGFREERVVAPIWTQGGFLRFVTVGPRTTTTWGVGFTSPHELTEIESLPSSIGPNEILIIPTVPRIATLPGHAALISCSRQGAKRTVGFVGKGQPREFSFSSDGCFLAYRTSDQEFGVWRECPAGFILHRSFRSNFARPLLSPNGHFIILSHGSSTELWRTTLPPSTTLTHHTPLILQFSPDRSLAATARTSTSTVTIIDLKSGDPRLIIDAGADICGAGVTGNTAIVICQGRIITWDVPAGDCALGGRGYTSNSVRIIVFNNSPPHGLLASISPDFSYVVTTDEEDGDPSIYDMSTGKQLQAHAGADRADCGDVQSFAQEVPWFTRDGREVWCSRTRGWKSSRVKIPISSSWNG